MSSAIKCESGNGAGKFYQVNPSGHLVLVTGDVAKPGWRLPTRTDIETAKDSERERASAEAIAKDLEDAAARAVCAAADVAK